MNKLQGQVARISLEALHQIARIALLLFVLLLAVLGIFAYSLSRHPLELPHIASWLATIASGNGITVHMNKAELAWEGYHQGGNVPLVLRLSGIEVHNAPGVLLVAIPKADFIVPPGDIFGGKSPILLRASAARLAGSTAPVTLHAIIWPGRGYSFSRGAFSVSIGAGSLGSGGTAVPVSRASFTMHTAPGAIAITDGMVALPPAGGSAPHAGFSFTASRNKDWAGTLHATIDAVQAQDMAQYWPAGVLPITRSWVVTNITAGTGGNADFTFSLTAPGDLSSLALTNATGGFDGKGLSLTWLKGVTPITGLDGHFAMPDVDQAVITSSAGQEGKVMIRQGRMLITGMNHKDQIGFLDMQLGGALTDVLNVLNAPPLSLLRQAPPEIAAATGQIEGHVTVTIPFKLTLAFNDVKLGVTATVQNLAVQTPAKALSASNGEARLQTDGHRLHLQAKAQFAGEPASLIVNESFAGAGHQDLTLKGAAGPQLWHFLGLDTKTELAAPAGGTAPFTIRVTGTATGAQTAMLDADLTPAAFALPVFAWSKQEGAPGHFAAAALLRNGAFVSVQKFSAHAPGLMIEGVQQGDALSFASVTIGRTQAGGKLTWPAGQGDGWVADFSGPALDIRQPKAKPAKPGAEVAAVKPAEPDNAPPTGPPWQAHLSFAQLYLAPSPAPALANFAFTAEGRGTTLLQAQGAAQGLTLTIAPQGTSRILDLHGDDAGMLLLAMNEYPHMQGGTLALHAEYGANQPTTGNASLANARFTDAPAVTKFLQGLTLYGLLAAASGPGLKISHAQVPFTLQDDVLTLHGARAYSSSLGFTANGSLDLAAGTCDLDTTIVPLYALNALPGKIPLIGRLFSPEKGGGLLAMRAHISGPIDHAKVSIDPLSALAPGFLRSIFGIGEKKAP